MSTSDDLRKKGDNLAKEGKLREAIELYKQSIANDRKNYLAYYNKGVTHLELGQNRKAAEELSYYVVKREKDIDGWINFAIALSNLHRFKDALSALQSALELSPNDPDIFFNMGIAHHSMGNFEDAKEVFERAVELDKNSVEYRYHLANLLADMNDLIGAKEIYLELLKENWEGNRTEVLYNLGNTLLDLEEYESAIEYYELALKLGGDRQIKFNLAFALEDKDPERSADLYRELIEDDPDFHEAHYNFACLLARQSKTEAIVHLKECLRIAKNTYLDSIESDPDLNKIRHLDEFQDIFHHEERPES